MRRLKPDPVPNELIRKILEAGVCAPSGGNMQRWRFLVIRDPKVKEAVGALYKRAWDERVAPRYRAGQPAPGMSQGTISAAPRRRRISGQPHPRGPGVDRPLPRGRGTDALVRLVHLPSGTEHAARGASPRPRRDIDDASSSVREGSGGRSRITAQRPIRMLCCRSAIQWADFGPVRRVPLADVVYEDRWGQPSRDV